MDKTELRAWLPPSSFARSKLAFPSPHPLLVLLLAATSAIVGSSYRFAPPHSRTLHLKLGFDATALCFASARPASTLCSLCTDIVPPVSDRVSRSSPCSVTTSILALDHISVHSQLHPQQLAFPLPTTTNALHLTHLAVVWYLYHSASPPIVSTTLCVNFPSSFSAFCSATFSLLCSTPLVSHEAKRFYAPTSVLASRGLEVASLGAHHSTPRPLHLQLVFCHIG
ncbi:uncharacterized protein SPSC_03924 [Sporisorium scitamineum]|uniref:Uncharacterized protein n=1 Tax=Sporisorium scitamineum TaxID=49012 RepID=A0A127Z540_9BASI|nr:uncharacterized protein SPSC_03924 [Sporisorium scitamineum]